MKPATRIRRLLVPMILSLPLILSGCSDDKQSAAGDKPLQQAAWINEEILIQLRDIREELKTLHADVAAIKTQLENVQVANARPAQPQAAVSSIPLASARQMGDTDATVAVLEFTDFQCPYCKRHHDQSFAQIKADYVATGKVQYFSMDFPLSFHSNAHAAAIAARCAGQQGKYWQMHDALFDNNRQLGAALYTKAAAGMALDAQAFATCLEDPAIAKAVDQDTITGSRYGVQGTPAFFLGRIKDGQLTDIVPMRGAQSYEGFARVIEALLEQG